MSKKAQAISELKTEASSFQQEVNILRQDLEHQNRLMKSMWKLIASKLELNENDLEEMMRTVKEEEAAKPDTAEACPQCSRPLQNTSPICIYCGAETDHQKLF